MDRNEAIRRSAQHVLLDALRKLFPGPLAELRDGLPFVRPPEASDDSPRPARSAKQAARIRAAQQRVQALTARAVDELPVGAVDLDAWAKRWRLDALRDLAPHLIAYWDRRRAAGARFYFPKIRPLPPPPHPDPALEPHHPAQPLLAAPERDETLADFVDRAKEHYRQRAEGVRRPRQLGRHAEWFVRVHVQGWTADQVAEAANDGAKDAPDVSTIRKGVAEFSRLLSSGGN